MSKEHGPKETCSKGVEAWELEMVRVVVRAFRTEEPEELQAHLSQKLATLKHAPHPMIRNWKAYIAKFLYNKGANWVRDTRARQRRFPIDLSGITERATPPTGHGDTAETAVALASATMELPSQLRRFWDVLVQENGNQTRAAEIVGVHRNTGRLWVAKIREVLERHGF